MPQRRHGLLTGISVLWLRVVVAQSSNVTVCIPDYQWTINSLKQTPCLVAAYLESTCGGHYQVNSIPNGTHYVGPNFTLANPCLCSSVTYSLISACGLCQNRTFETWTNWALNCIQTEIADYPKPINQTVVVPLWAYLNITQTNNTFSPQAAQNNQTLAASSSSQSSSFPSTVSQLTTTPVVPLPTTSPALTPKKDSNAGAIAGGVVGGLILIAAVGAAFFWFYTRHWIGQPTTHSTVNFDEASVSASTGQMEKNLIYRDGPSPVSTSTSPGHQHNTSLSSNTSPRSPVMSAVYTTYDPRRSTDTFPQAVQNQRGFPGVAEL